MSKITRNEAIRKCKELWAEIEASGLAKYDFLDTEMGAKWNNRYKNDCPLCEIADACIDCPLYQEYGKSCYKLGYKGTEHEKCTKEWFKKIRNLKEESNGQDNSRG